MHKKTLTYLKSHPILTVGIWIWLLAFAFRVPITRTAPEELRHIWDAGRYQYAARLVHEFACQDIHLLCQNKAWPEHIDGYKSLSMGIDSDSANLSEQEKTELRQQELTSRTFLGGITHGGLTPYLIWISYYISNFQSIYFIWLQIILDSFTAVLVYLLGYQLSGQRLKIAFTAGLLYVFYVPAVLATQRYMQQVPGAFFTTGALTFLATGIRLQKKSWLTAGLIAGILASYTIYSIRPFFILVLPVLLTALLWQNRRLRWHPLKVILAYAVFMVVFAFLLPGHLIKDSYTRFAWLKETLTGLSSDSDNMVSTNLVYQNTDGWSPDDGQMGGFRREQYQDMSIIDQYRHYPTEMTHQALINVFRLLYRPYNDFSQGYFFSARQQNLWHHLLILAGMVGFLWALSHSQWREGLLIGIAIAIIVGSYSFFHPENRHAFILMPAISAFAALILFIPFTRPVMFTFAIAGLVIAFIRVPYLTALLPALPAENAHHIILFMAWLLAMILMLRLLRSWKLPIPPPQLVFIGLYIIGSSLIYWTGAPAGQNWREWQTVISSGNGIRQIIKLAPSSGERPPVARGALLLDVAPDTDIRKLEIWLNGELIKPAGYGSSNWTFFGNGHHTDYYAPLLNYADHSLRSVWREWEQINISPIYLIGDTLDIEIYPVEGYEFTLYGDYQPDNHTYVGPSPFPGPSNRSLYHFEYNNDPRISVTLDYSPFQFESQLITADGTVITDDLSELPGRQTGYFRILCFDMPSELLASGFSPDNLAMFSSYYGIEFK